MSAATHTLCECKACRALGKRVPSILQAIDITCRAYAEHIAEHLPSICHAYFRGG